MAQKLIAIIVTLACLVAASEFVSAADRPNVLFIMADDLGVFPRCYGNTAIETPHIDSLAETGVRFDDAYCQYPLCGPSRCSLLFGKRPDAVKVFVNEVSPRYALPDAKTLPQAFREAGYRTIKVGKLFHGNPYDKRQQGWQNDLWDDATSWEQAYWFDREAINREVDQIGAKHGRYKGAGSLDWVMSTTSSKQSPDGRIATLAIEKMQAAKADPFFLAVGFFVPHTPWIAPAEHFESIPLESVPLFTAAASEQRALEVMPKNGDYDRGMDDAQRRKSVKAYYACVQYLDSQVGRLLSALEEQGLIENTIIVFLGDHGYQLGHHGMWHKYGLYDQTLRTPLIIRAPKQSTSGDICERPVEFIDIYPTLLDLAGIKPLDDLHGRSLTPLLRNPSAQWNHPAYSMHVPVNRDGRIGRSVRYGDWHYFEWRGDETHAFLFNLKNDPAELKNRAANPQYLDRVNEMKSLLAAGAKAVPPSPKAIAAQQFWPPNLDEIETINRTQ
ncbi:sulfatase [Stratiformator vulcanicus]|uniref:Arylsulfatase n=1 Tax=Stratiformator vulcanicus TaxID=2527980 RepID=A0A517R609_9PLAN|nr:sulfatase [Stratiformator vulcanicus]QDT39275.1 Arylsulfatase [Stratiformator vulcanicus]